MPEVNIDNFDTEVLESKIPVVIDFWTSWCAPCKEVESALRELSKKLEGKIKFVRANVEETQSLASTYMVMSIPSLIIFKNGIPYGKKTGSASKMSIEKFISSCLCAGS